DGVGLVVPAETDDGRHAFAADRVLQVDRVLVEEGRRDEVADHPGGKRRTEDRQGSCAVEHRLRVSTIDSVVHLAVVTVLVPCLQGMIASPLSRKEVAAV